MRTFKGSYISDHRAIVTELDIRIQHTLGKTVTFRDLKQINMEEFKSALNLGNIENMENLTLVNEKYEEELSRVLDHLAPEKTKFVTMKEKRPWFDEDVANLRRLLRRFGMIWLRIRSDNSWNAYKQIRKQYQHKLAEMKREKISLKIVECGSNSKKLFQLLNHLTGHKPEIPLLTRNSDKELMDEFASYFLNKIVRKREGLDDQPLYQSSKNDPPEFSNFKEVSKDQVQRLVMRTKSKSCELDLIPTTLLKNILSSILPAITKIINLSLLSGTFLQNWKTAIVIPLLKKQGMELLKSNYRPVSNLPYISKLVKEAMLEQINLHCNAHSLLPDYQSAYRENRSCETVLLKLTNDLL